MRLALRLPRTRSLSAREAVVGPPTRTVSRGSTIPASSPCWMASRYSYFPGEPELVAVCPGAERDAGLPQPALLGLVLAGADPARRLQPLVDRRELLPRQHELRGDGVCLRPAIAQGDRLVEAEHVEEALDQLEVLHVLAGDEMEDEVALGTGVAPGLVRLEARGGVRRPAARLAVADVNHAPVVEIPAAGVVAFDDVVMAGWGGGEGSFSGGGRRGGGGAGAPPRRPR